MERIMPCGNEGKWTVPLTMCIKGIRRLWWAINKNLWLFSKPPPAKSIRTCNGMANQETCLRQCMRKLKALGEGAQAPYPKGKTICVKWELGLWKSVMVTKNDLRKLILLRRLVLIECVFGPLSLLTVRIFNCPAGHVWLSCTYI